jgi:uncharacterized protein (DUF427 family)
MAESVWEYPRPPRLEPSPRRIQVKLGDAVVADSTRAYRVLETSHAPVYYLPLDDITPGALEPSAGRGSFCEWKGAASYYDVVAGGRRLARAAWAYATPASGFAPIAGYVAFYPTELECTVDGERARPQEGGFYGGWITDDILGPFKGGPGTSGW